ncbi:MAG TPA: hypothetical protein VKA50_05885, partial [Gammaproteobacteria bacterium]|nr:hypothetical protein [Gammaproteobacteria bacterium]
HSDEYSPRCSWTNRTARSRTSGENLFDLFMAPFSQMLEPPQNPGRFILYDLIDFEPEKGAADVRLEDDFIRELPEGAISCEILLKYRKLVAKRES